MMDSYQSSEAKEWGFEFLQTNPEELNPEGACPCPEAQLSLRLARIRSLEAKHIGHSATCCKLNTLLFQLGNTPESLLLMRYEGFNIKGRS